MKNNMGKAIHETLDAYLQQRYMTAKDKSLNAVGIKQNEEFGIEQNEGFSIKQNKEFCRDFQEKIKASEDWISNNFINLKRFNKSYRFSKINNTELDEKQRALQPLLIGIEDIKNAKIEDQELLILVKTFLVYDLFKNNNLSLNQNKNKAWTYDIFNELGDDKNKLVAEYNLIRESEFMKNMRQEYLKYNHRLKTGLTYSKVMEEMFSLKHKEIDGWDKFCHFFAHVAKLIYNVLSLGEYQSTKDLKDADNIELATENNINVKDLESWTAFSKRYETKVKESIDLER